MQKKTSIQESHKELPYDVFTDIAAYHIVFNLPVQASVPLNCFLNQTERNLVIVPNQSDKVSASHLPCIFKAPADANLDDVRIQSRKTIHMISIPRIRKNSLPGVSVQTLSYPVRVIA